MAMHKEILDGLNVALNEADLLGVEVSEAEMSAAITLKLLTLANDTEPPPSDSRISLRLTNISRVCASLRKGHWDDKKAQVVPFALEKILPTVQSFGGQPIYGWDFFDCESDFPSWKSRVSLDHKFANKHSSHTLHLFQESLGEESPRHLDICIWFDDLYFQDADRNLVDSTLVIEGGKRWWDALYNNDPRARSSGISPA